MDSIGKAMVKGFVGGFVPSAPSTVMSIHQIINKKEMKNVCTQ